MQHDNSHILICDYEPRYAKTLAEMWNQSTEAWNGHLFSYSEAQILEEEANSTAIARYLALEGERVVGYVNLYRDEEKLANVGMLNVLPSHHGTGLGKELLKRCVLKAASLNMPIISLYTWAGNTKAVPLYKKCGFFWQKLEASATYLINFLPGLLTSELLAPYFEYFDWYDDLVRDLKVEPDGEEEAGFILYTYLWQKDGRSLRVVFDKVSRSITKIECEDFYFRSSLAVAEPVFGTKHMISYAYDCFNPAFEDIQIHSRPEHNIDFDFSYQGHARPELRLNAEYSLLPITKDFSEWEALPGVKSELVIAGKSIIVGNSQKVRYPIELSLKAKRLLRTGDPEILYLSIKNNLERACELKLSFPEDARLSLCQTELGLRLKAKEKIVHPLDIILKGSCFYAAEVLAELSSDGKAPMQFTLHPDIILPCLSGTDAKRSKDKAMLICGSSYFEIPLTEQKNWGYLVTNRGNCVYSRPSDFGRPFSAEFDNEDAVNMVFDCRDDMAMLELFYESKKHVGLRFSKIYELYGSGEMQLRLRFQEIPHEHEPLCVRECFATQTAGFSFINRDRMITLAPEMEAECLSDFDINDLSEPWLFFDNGRISTGITWDELWKPGYDRWWISFEMDLAKIKALPDMQSPPLKIYPDTFLSAYHFRDFATREEKAKIPREFSADIVLNGNNPFYDEKLDLKVVHHQQMGVKGSLRLPSLGFSADAENDKNITLPLPNEPIALLDTRIDYPSFSVNHPRVLLHRSGSISYTEDEDSLSMDNGILRIMAKKNSALPTIASLELDGTQWLDPIPQGFVPRSSFNPYPGGILCSPSSVKPINFMQDRHILKKAKLEDQKGNLWQGLSWESEITHFEPLKGLVYRQYYLSSPGLPILMVMVKIVQGIKKAGYLAFGVATHYHPQNVMPNAVFSYPDAKNRWHEYRNSHLMLHRGDQGCISRVRVDETNLHLLSFSNRAFSMSSNKDFMRSLDMCYSRINPQNGEVIEPIFMLFDKRKLEPEMLQDLLSLQPR